jgi:hypothetical protein
MPTTKRTSSNLQHIGIVTWSVFLTNRHLQHCHVFCCLTNHHVQHVDRERPRLIAISNVLVTLNSSGEDNDVYWGRILGRNWDKSLKSFPSCYSQSPLLMDFTARPLEQKWVYFKLVFNVNIVLNRKSENICPETSTKRYVHEFGFRSTGLLGTTYIWRKLFQQFWQQILRKQFCAKAGSLKMNTAPEYSTRVVQEGGRRCKKSTHNDLVHLTPLRIPLMNPPKVFRWRQPAVPLTWPDFQFWWGQHT